MDIIKTIGLTKRYNGFNAVKDFNITIKESEIFSLLGPNGAGKTTTIRMLTTLTVPTKGTAIINGYDIVKNPDKVRESIGVMFQETVLDEELTAMDNMNFYADLYNMPKSEKKKRIHELLKRLRLENRRKDRVETFSGGMKRKLELAMAMLHKPKVLFLDEPSLGLDPQSRRVIWNYILKLKKQGVTIFLTTHYMEEADMLSDKVAIINKGRVIVVGSPEQLKKSIRHYRPTLEDVFLHFVGELD
ncbi:MAG: ATP-binding cassette domain-containing protein [Candidatus Aenigmarchaeota archaeon]|nr:ATP-binding cassette domain-containing protein [Candidatus Aenigmarchaeota archaeon]